MTRILFFLFLLFSFATFSSIFQSKKSKNQIPLGPKKPKKNHQTYFSLSKQDYENLGEGILGSKNHRVKKNLEQFLILSGINSRPDSQPKCFYCSYRGKALKFNEKIWYPLPEIIDEGLEDTANYYFEMTHTSNGALVQIRDRHNANFSFELKAQPTIKSAQIGDYKLDIYLLVRQKVAWVGQDLFLEKYGGEEFSKFKGAQRLDFMHSKSGYYLFAKENSQFVWKDGLWCAAGADSINYPLMKIEKISPKVMEIVVWDVSGLQREKVFLTKSKPPEFFKKESSLRYIGAKSTHKWLFKTDKERLTIEEGDWLILSNGRWSKVSSGSEIDQYVSRVGFGELFVVKALTEQNGKKQLTGDLFNSSRTEITNLALDVSKTSKFK